MTNFTDTKIAKGFKATEREELLERLAAALEGMTTDDGSIYAEFYNKGGIAFFVQDKPSTKHVSEECVSQETFVSLFGEGFEFADYQEDNMEAAEIILTWMENQN